MKKPRTTIDLGPYGTVPEFVYGMTREIWEDRGIGAKLQQYYAHDVLVRAATGLTVGNAGVTAQTLQTLHQFPDRQLVGEDVIWKPYAHGGYLSSHRLTSVMRHTGDGAYGRAQGKRVRTRIIADCWIGERQVKEEWLVRDQAAFAHCLGIEPRALAREMVERDIRNGVEIGYFMPARDKAGRYKPQIEDDPAVAAYCAGLGRIWQDKELAAIRDMYHHGAAFHAPGGDVLYGHADIDRFALGYLASFPDAALRIESAIVNQEPESPVRLAVRWSLTGTHGGFGHFGEPSGAPVYVMGINHAHMTAGLVHMEWMVTDEVSIWKQIHAHLEGKAGA